MDRGSLTDRKGVNIVESIFLNDFDWAFRDQTILDYGVDAIVEQRIDNNPTGKLLSLQIKTGLSYVKTNAKGDFDYYPTMTHVAYWLSFSIPVILVFCNPETKLAYWIQITKRNLRKTSTGNYKITIQNTSFLNIDSRPELESIIAVYSSNGIFDDEVENMSAEELSEYAGELMSHCSDSLKLLRQSIDNHGKDSCVWVNSLEMLLSDSQTGKINDSERKKRIQSIGCTFSISLNVLTTRLSGKDKEIAIEAHIKALYFIDKAINTPGKDTHLIYTCLSEELIKERDSIISLIKIIKQVSHGYKECDQGWGSNFVNAMHRCSITVEDYVAELESLSGIIQKYIDKLSN